jgi:hypothetical protein
MSTSLATSSLLKAVGVGNSAVGATAAAAAIKWITKDGIGAAGRVLVSNPQNLKVCSRLIRFFTFLCECMPERYDLRLV